MVNTATTTTATPTIVVFDLGGVLFDWNPDYLYRKLIADEAERKWFLANICNGEWNVQQDGGRSLSEATAVLSARHPDHAHLIGAFYARWTEMLGGTLAGGMAIFEALESAGVPLYALTNWSAETFPYARNNHPFQPVLQRFKDVLVSGEEKLIKPDARIYQRMLERIRKHYPTAQAEHLVFIDDVQHNVDAARTLGWRAIHHTDPAATAAQLRNWGLPA
ncbi:HAD hydrolase, IA, variant 3 family protein [Collimonas fungivorans]|uniref:HAD hydrolase, IA, variant 3 family protein n=1 Tax=Collimonas fungivorans TaxID=158899 RepID=A0A127PH24_9BURK|nr:HAD family phosphatase [Collimonas fungivorans]AMO97025.1 HAD hydrolase, IA, variant 3 family protein [Collimonas fungivorans]